MIPRNLQLQESGIPWQWQELSEAVPTVVGFAMLASRAIGGLCTPVDPLGREALAILYAARNRGMIELRGNPESFDSSDRLLAVCVELEGSRAMMFKQKSQPARTMAFLEGFRQLCQSGLVIHQMQKEFSLTAAGFALAQQIDAEPLGDELAFAIEYEL